MKAPFRHAADLANVPAAITRDLLGFAKALTSSIAYHTILSPLGSDSGLGLVDSTWAAGTRTVPHRHHQEDEILIVLSGTIESRIAGRTSRHDQGETVFVRRGLEHDVRALTPTRMIAILTRNSIEGPRLSLAGRPA